MRNANTTTFPNGSMVAFGKLVSLEPEALAKRELLYPVELDEPDTDIEVGYSKVRGKPLHIIYKDREVELTLATYKLFVYIYEQYRKTGKKEFAFEEISEGLTGNDCDMSSSAIGTLTYRLAGSLSKILSPFTVRHRREIFYICPQT